MKVNTNTTRESFKIVTTRGGGSKPSIELIPTKTKKITIKLFGLTIFSKEISE